jgi:ACT domain-containing protein
MDMLKQLSLYVENKKGVMRDITSILKDEGINIFGSVNHNDGAEYGVIRMVVSEPERALESMKAAGYMCRMVDVMGIELADEVGSLNHLLGALSDSNINVDYIYLSFNRDSARPILIMHAADEDIYEVESCMEAKGFTVV